MPSSKEILSEVGGANFTNNEITINELQTCFDREV